MSLIRITTCILAIVPSTVAFTFTAPSTASKAFVRSNVRTGTTTRSFTPPRRSLTTTTSLAMAEKRYSNPDQPARFAKAKADKNEHFLDITTVYDPTLLKGKRVAVTGANRGVGLALAIELTEAGAAVVALVRKSSPELDALKPVEIVEGVELTNDKMCAALPGKITGGPIDIVSWFEF